MLRKKLNEEMKKSMLRFLKNKYIVVIVIAVVVIPILFSACKTAVTSETTAATKAETTEEETSEATEASTETEAAEAFVIGLSNFSLGNSWRVQMVAEAQYAASQNPLVKELIVTEAEESAEKQISDIEDLISRGVDAILITAVNPEALVPVVDEAMEAGIVVVDFDNIVYTDNITCHVKVDQKEFGRVQGEWLVKALGEKGDIIAFNGIKGTAISAERFEGAKSVFDQYPDIKIVQDVAADWDYARAKAAMEDLLAAYPEIDGIWSQGGAMSEGAVEAYMEKGLTPPPVTGEDGNGFLKLWKEIRDSGKYPTFDSIATSMPTWCSAKALEVALDALIGKTVEKEIVIPIPTITAETLDDYVKPDLPDSYWCNSQLPEEIVLEIFTR
jgi:ribose transport system substrate-binding protein